MKKLLAITLSITMLLSMGAVAFADDTFVSSGAREVEGIIKVGVNAEFPPFEYMENDKLLGFDIDLMNYIAGRIGYGVEFINMSFDKLIPAVVNGEVDCAISAITATDEREGVVDFTRPYLAANVTYKDEDTDALEEYAIVFKNGVSDAIYKSSMPTDDEKLFMLVNGTLEELIADATVEKLIEKYNLNKSADENADVSYEYIVIKSTATDAKNGIEIHTPSEWAAKDIDFAYAMGITDNNKQYIYQNNITREEFCELIYNLVTLTKSEITAPVTDSFTDTKNEKILMLNGLGIINGKTATEFAPNDYLTREEAATIIIRMINKIMPMAATEMWFEYDDIDEISKWASDSVQTISNLGFMNGVGNNRFAPKDTYTTEQAIATLVRVYRAADAAGAIAPNISIGTIGGADGPTSIIVGGAGAPAQITVTDTIELDDFYIDEAVKLIAESGKLAADKEFISYYTADEEMTANILELGAADYSEPSAIYYMAADKEQIIANIKALSAELDGEELNDLDIEKLLQLNKVNFSVLANMINASYGSQSLAALTILTNSEGYIMPKDFEKDFALYLEYDDGCSALVSFSEYGEGVISANMSFVINGDKDNIFSRLYEITQGLGEDSIYVAKVKR